MKKTFLFALLIIASVSVFAQKGRHSVGISVEELGTIMSDEYLHTHEGSWGITAKYQYGISDYFRVEPSVTYYIVNREGEKYDIRKGWDCGCELKYAAGISIHAFLKKTTRLKPYVVAGIRYLHGEEYYYEWNSHSTEYEYDEWDDAYYPVESDYYYDKIDDKKDFFDVKAGLGLDYRIAYNWNLQLEACYTTALQAESIKLGLTYNF